MSYLAGPFDAQHMYLQWGGKLPGNEQWSCGLRLANTSGSGFVVTSGALAAVTAAVTAYHTSVAAQISARALLSSVKLNLIDVSGHYAEPLTHETLVADAGGAGAAADTPPNQICHVISLTTGYSRGPAHRGRFYAPLPCYPVGTDGRFSASMMVDSSGAVDTFIAALNAADANFKVAVFSRKSGAAAHRLVTGNQVGRVPDTQRRRRRSMVEDYQ